MTTPSAFPIDAQAADDAPRSRRNLLRLAGAAAAGATAVALGSATSAAADTGYSTGGATTVGDVVRQQLNGSRSTEYGFLFATVSEPMLSNNSATWPAAVAGLAIDGQTANGAHFRSETNMGHGAVIEASGEYGIGVRATAKGIGGTGLWALGDAAALELHSEPSVPSPPDRSTAGWAGMMAVDYEYNLWFCTTNGTPGQWRKLAGRQTGGTFHPVTPTRVYDSRSPAPAQGKLAGGNHRTVAIKDGRDLSTGAVNASDIVPAGATAIAVNVGITQTATGGWLTVNPGGTTTIGASSINWSATGQVLANGIIAKINETTRELTIVAGGAGETHFFLDVTGYWR